MTGSTRFAAIIMGAVLVASVPGAEAQSQAQARGSAGSWSALPDWSGVWQMQGNTVFDRATVWPSNAGAGTTPHARMHPPLNAEWAARYTKNIAGVVEGTFPDPLTYCGIPAGMPRMLNQPDGYEWIVTPHQVWQTTENAGGVRRIYTDGRGHPPNLTPSYNGHSVGRWEGDTLVVETVGMRSDGIIDRTGLQLSGQRKVTERIRRIDANTIEDRMTIEDPAALTAPWNVVKRFQRQPPGTYVFDYACAENNRNPVNEFGRTITTDATGKPLHD